MAQMTGAAATMPWEKVMKALGNQLWARSSSENSDEVNWPWARHCVAHSPWAGCCEGHWLWAHSAFRNWVEATTLWAILLAPRRHSSHPRHFSRLRHSSRLRHLLLRLRLSRRHHPCQLKTPQPVWMPPPSGWQPHGRPPAANWQASTSTPRRRPNSSLANSNICGLHQTSRSPHALPAQVGRS